MDFRHFMALNYRIKLYCTDKLTNIIAAYTIHSVIELQILVNPATKEVPAGISFFVLGGHCNGNCISLLVVT